MLSEAIFQVFDGINGTVVKAIHGYSFRIQPKLSKVTCILCVSLRSL